MGGGGQGGGAAAPPGPVESDKSSRDGFVFLDSDILILVTCNCLPFSWPRNWLVHGV